MGTEPQGIVQGRKSGKENDRPVPGIHFKVKKDFQVIQNRVCNIVSFINDDNGSFSLFHGKPVDFLLYDTEVFGLAESRFAAQLHNEVAVKITDGECGKTGINDLVKGRV